MILKNHLAHDWSKTDPGQTLVTEKELLNMSRSEVNLLDHKMCAPGKKALKHRLV